jgi:hypothetical protein
MKSKMTVEFLNESEIASGVRAKRCLDGSVRLARVGMTGEGDDMHAVLGWYLPRTGEDRREARKFLK